MAHDPGAHDAGGWRARLAQGGADLRVASTFLTRLSIPASAGSGRGDLAAGAWAFPLVGIAVGLAGGLAFSAATGFGLTSWLAAIAAVAVQLALTGALHEDAVADVADGFGGGADRDAKLAIMRDSRIGTYGVSALILALAARLGALAALADPGAVVAALVVAGAVSRGGMVWLMRALPPARDDGLGHAAGIPARDAVAGATIIAGIVALLLAGIGGGVAALVGAGLGTLAIGALARRQIGGQTGDVLGAGQQVAEVLCLAALIAVG